jgi:hypothetical protein
MRYSVEDLRRSEHQETRGMHGMDHKAKIRDLLVDALLLERRFSKSRKISAQIAVSILQRGASLSDV